MDAVHGSPREGCSMCHGPRHQSCYRGKSEVGNAWHRGEHIATEHSLGARGGAGASGAEAHIGSFYLEGWDVAEFPPLGAERKPDLVILSLSQRDRIPIAREAAKMLSPLDAPLAISVANRALPRFRRSVGLEAISVAKTAADRRRLLGCPGT